VGRDSRRVPWKAATRLAALIAAPEPSDAARRQAIEGALVRWVATTMDLDNAAIARD
jgi:hypothetical protein